MPAIDSLQTLLVEQLKDVYDAEKRLTKAIPKMAKIATHDELRSALESHLAETQEHVTRLEQIFEQLGERAKAKPCAGMRGIIEEGEEHAKEDYEDDGLRDAAIIGGAQRVEHYEIAAYGTSNAHARLLGLDDVVSTLEQTLEEEKAADEKLTEIAEGVVNLDAASEEGEEDEEEMSGRGARKQRAASQPAAMAADMNRRGGSGSRGGSSRSQSGSRGGSTRRTSSGR
jgi:ferritin-like metal-binding protein YciE